MQQIYAEPVRAELITERLREIRDAGVTVAGSLSPQRTKEFAKTVVDAGVDTGPILAQRALGINAGETEDQLHERIKVLERELIVSTLVGIAAGEVDLADAAARRPG